MSTFDCHVAQRGFYAGPVYVVDSTAGEAQTRYENPEGELLKLRGAVES